MKLLDMKSYILVLLIVLVSTCLATVWSHENRIPYHDMLYPHDSGVLFSGDNPKPTAKPYKFPRGVLDLPKQHDWRDTHLLHAHVTQRVPQWCGACFAFGAVSVTTDRLNLHYNKQFGGVPFLSVQQVLNCANDAGYGPVGCLGSQFEKVFEYIKHKGLVDSTCSPYLGIERSVSSLHGECEDYQCRQCTSDGTCSVVPYAKRWYIEEWGTVKGEDAMLQELYARGPLTCYVYTYVPSYINYKGGILVDNTQFAPNNVTHVISVVGYGEENNTPYWIARNWAGTAWGENGWFRVFRGNNTLNIESNCGFAIPSQK